MKWKPERSFEKGFFKEVQYKLVAFAQSPFQKQGPLEERTGLQFVLSPADLFSFLKGHRERNVLL